MKKNGVIRRGIDESCSRRYKVEARSAVKRALWRSQERSRERAKVADTAPTRTNPAQTSFEREGRRGGTTEGVRGGTGRKKAKRTWEPGAVE